VRKKLVKDELGRDLTIHCAEEMNRLAGFLPQLCEEQKGVIV
jgi:hypothetical protein